MLQLNERDRVDDPRMPTVQRYDRAGGRWSPLRSFSAKEQHRENTVNEFTAAIC
jgi:hypothetical protein